jgi:tripartite-type tricarboxylate transporter receptor subunit TctC
MIRYSRCFAWSFTCLLAILGAGELAAQQQSYPSAPIRVIVPTGPGSPPDVLSRILANELSSSEGWRMVVENRPGAIQTIGVAEVLNQPSDGHTLLAITVPVLAAPSLLPKSGLRLDRDLVPVIKVSTGSNVLVVNPSVPARSVPELIALLKSQPDKLHFASGGVGNPAHLIGEMFKLQTGTRATHVPYPQGQQFVPDLLSGVTQFSFITSVRVIDLVAAGQLRALAVMGPTRIPALKDVPSIAEAGFPSLAVEDWVGFAARSGTPDEVIARLNAAINKAITKPQVREAMARVGNEPAGGTAAEFGKLMNKELAHWQKVILEADIRNH